LVIENKKAAARTLLPLFAEELLLERTDIDDDTTIVQEYKLIALGPIWKSEIEPDSHLGSVSFSFVEGGDETEQFSGTEMTWNVTFNTLNRQNLWQSVTESSISDACENLKAHLSQPILFTKKMVIQTDSTPKVLAEQWFEFVWRNGGGLPLPLPPISLSKNGHDRMIVPPFLRERILDIKVTSEFTDIIYTVANPSLLTYPVYTHLGRVRFQTLAADQVEMTWEVSIRPIRNCKSFVKNFTETVINVLARNFKSHVQDVGTNAMVNVYPPRGFMKDKGPLFQVRKDTWLGSVLYAHLRDNRSVVEQTKDLFQPWRWGTIDENEENGFSWSVGEISNIE